MTNAEKIKACLDDLNQRFKSFSDHCPQVWQNIDRLRAIRPSLIKATNAGKLGELEIAAKHVPKDSYFGIKENSVTEWPNWCFIPYQINYSAPPLGNRGDEHTYWGQVSNLAAWRQTKGIYAFEPYFGAELFKTPVTGKIPVEILTRMPAWSTLVTLPDGAFSSLGAGAALGALCQMTLVGQHYALAIALLGPAEEHGHFVMPIEGTLEQSLNFVNQCIADSMAKRDNVDGIALKLFTQCQDDLAGLLSTLLYLCSEKPEVDKIIPRPQPVKTKHGPRVFPAQQPTVVEVGIRIGSVLRKALEPSTPVEQTAQPGHHASPRPHIRRAHWHTFLSGSRLEPIPHVKWLPPILVNEVLGAPDIVLHPVKPITAVG